jgi:hypothetical protein
MPTVGVEGQIAATLLLWYSMYDRETAATAMLIAFPLVSTGMVVPFLRELEAIECFALLKFMLTQAAFVYLALAIRVVPVSTLVSFISLYSLAETGGTVYECTMNAGAATTHRTMRPRG